MDKSLSAIRQIFLDFFSQNKHTILPSSNLIPTNDSTLLFTNAGMNQFKNIFLGKEEIKYKRIVTAQRCVRAGGKHNDLENVGYSTRHHTFFEMLGNFSFGDYFKETAIKLAWELLTSNKWFNLPKEKLLVTVYYKDEETFNIWKKIGLPENKIIRIGDSEKKIYKSDNFWQMGETGPCGPCTEIFFELSPSSAISELSFNKINDHYIEIWNIVFIQFNKQKNGSIYPLKMLSVDTGMGLERITSIIQGVNSNYEIDFFYKLIKEIANIMNVKFDIKNNSLNVIADHIRSSVFLMYDGVVPSNINKGYVLRRIIRRALRHGYLLGTKNMFFYKLVPVLTQVMEIKLEQSRQNFIQKLLHLEESLFQNTLKNGLSIFNKEIKKLKNNKLDGLTIFRLYDTFGLPIDVIEDICRERKVEIDKSQFILEMNKQKFRSKNKNFIFYCNQNIHNEIITEFQGYKKLKIKSKIKFILIEDTSKKIIKENQFGIIVLEKTPFYGQSGGQIGDKGILNFYKNKFIVLDTQKKGQAVYHIGKVISGTFKVGNHITASVDKINRMNISKNHSATHLLNTALEHVLGEHVIQKGSFINNKYLRLDFSHLKQVTDDQIKKIENIVNFQIRNNLIVKDCVIPFDTVQQQRVKYLPNEKYENDVRVLTIGNFSKELCCGTHVKRTGDIGIFHIINESSIAQGIRRIECVTGEQALYKIQSNYDQIKQSSLLLKITDNNLYKKIIFLNNYTKNLESELQKFKNKYVMQTMFFLEKKILKINNINILIVETNDFDHKMMCLVINNFKNRLKSAVIIITTILNKKIFIVSGVTKNLTNLFQANRLIKLITDNIKGQGGGNPQLAQGSGQDMSVLNKSLNDVKYFIIQEIKSRSKEC